MYKDSLPIIEYKPVTLYKAVVHNPLLNVELWFHEEPDVVTLRKALQLESYKTEKVTRFRRRKSTSQDNMNAIFEKDVSDEYRRLHPSLLGEGSPIVEEASFEREIEDGAVMRDIAMKMDDKVFHHFNQDGTEKLVWLEKYVPIINVTITKVTLGAYAVEVPVTLGAE